MMLDGKSLPGPALRILVPLLVGLDGVAAEAGPALADPVPATGLASGAAFLGPFHMVVLHFPIGLFSFAALLELLAWLRPFDGLRRVLTTTLGLGVASAVLASVLGLYRSAGGDYDPGILAAHRNGGIALTVVAGVTVLLHQAALRSGPEWLGWYRGAMGATLSLLLVTSHHGGSLTHGQGFLTRNAPQPVRDWMARWEGAAAGVAPRGPGSPQGVHVAHLLESKCLSCHGPEKQKGGFRVDRREAMLRGGDSGVPAVVPGDPGRSALVRLILLPGDHDDVMPPSGKPPLTDAEILEVCRWIRSGAR
jgi:uncharacterized membrane protein